MMRAYKFRLYPNSNQTILINKTLGSTRFVYNYYLSKKKDEYAKDKTKISCYECIKDLTSDLSKEKEWLKEVDSMSLRCALFDLDDAYQRMFKQGSGYPKFKSKHNIKNSYRTNYTNDNIRLDLNNKIIRLPKLKDINIRGYRNISQINGRIINATISKEANGKYYVSILVEEKDMIKEVTPQSIIGLDLGLKDIVVTSDGDKYKNEKTITKYEHRIKLIQRRLSKKVPRSNNYYKMKKRLAVLYKKLQNARKNIIHHITKKIVKENDIIVAETLSIKNMTKNHNLSKSIIDVTWYELIRQIGYKSKCQGKKFYQIDTFYPSSQICSKCGHKNSEVKNLSVREWKCIECGNEVDRDINASINIMFEGLKKYMQAVYA